MRIVKTELSLSDIESWLKQNSFECFSTDSDIWARVVKDDSKRSVDIETIEVNTDEYLTRTYIYNKPNDEIRKEQGIYALWECRIEEWTDDDGIPRTALVFDTGCKDNCCVVKDAYYYAFGEGAVN